MCTCFLEGDYLDWRIVFVPFLAQLLRILFWLPFAKVVSCLFESK